MEKLCKKRLKVDLCVVGGGMAGLNVAITSARLGLKVALIQERPVFGGNASGEIRMWVCGIQDFIYRETGLSEEINLENYYYNPTKAYPLWDALLYGKVQAEENIIPLLNCTCFDAQTHGNTIQFVTAYQMTTQTLFEVEARYFADCSGDSILAPLTGAHFSIGREAKAEHDEPMQTHEDSDGKTMGNSCLLQARQTDKKVPFRAPSWAEKVSVEKLKSKNVDLRRANENFWYIELGGVLDTIADAEYINKRLLALCLGIWDTIKNSGEFDADCFELEFIGFLGAKRESRRMKGDYTLTANDIAQGKVFEDTVAYGGWPLDDHNPEGFDGDKSNYMIHVQKPYGIPYRCLYSKNIANLFFAGRNISATHMAMSSARVMGTCSIIGQAVGVASAVAKKYGISPREVSAHIQEVQQLLLKHDCYLPQIKRETVCQNATLTGASDLLRNGEDRDFYGQTNGEFVENGKSVKYLFDTPAFVSEIKIVFDSDLTRSTYETNDCEKHHSTRCNILADSPVMHMPKTLAKAFEVEVLTEGGERIRVLSERENKRRNILLPVGCKVREIALTVLENWGDTQSTKVFTFEYM